MTAIDPDLIGIWIAPGNPATYEVDAEGGYHIAEPESPVSFEEDGAVLIWGARRLDREGGSGTTPVGRWIDRDSRDIWAFETDQTYTVESDGITDVGIWALRDGGRALWTRERTALLQADGARVTFRQVGAAALRYNYTVKDGIWTLLDEHDWTEVAAYVRPGYLKQAQ